MGHEGQERIKENPWFLGWVIGWKIKDPKRQKIQEHEKEKWHLRVWRMACLVSIQFSSVAQSCLTLWTPWTAAHQASLSIINSWSLLKLMSIELVMPSHHLILSHPLLLLMLEAYARARQMWQVDNWTAWVRHGVVRLMWDLLGQVVDGSMNMDVFLLGEF